MIAVYVQSEVRQGIDVAVDGAVVDAQESRFVDLRSRSITLNLRRKPIRVDSVLVRVGRGIARLEFEPGAARDSSPIVVVVTSRELAGERQDVVESVVRTARALDCNLNPAQVEAGLRVAARLARDHEVTRIIFVGAGAALIGMCASTLLRSAAARRRLT